MATEGQVSSLLAIARNIPDAICSIDLDYTIRSWNKGAETMLGYKAEEIIGKNLAVITPGELAEKEIEFCINTLNAEGIITGHETVRVAKDGKMAPVELTAVALKDEEGKITGYAAVMRDISERKRAEEALRRANDEMEVRVRERTRELARVNEELRVENEERRRAVESIRRSQALSDALNKLDAVIHSTLDLDQIMQRVVEESARAMRADATLIGTFEGDLFHVRYTYNMPETLVGRILTASELRAIHHAALAGDALAFNDAFNDERLNIAFVREIGIRSLLVSPIVIKDTTAGALVFYGLSRQIVFGEEQIDFARKLSSSVSLALENARLYQELQESERRLRAILDSIPDMAWLKDRESRLIAINEAYAAWTGMSPEDLTGKTDFDAWPDYLAEKYRADDKEVMQSGKRKRVEEPVVDKNGKMTWIETIKTPIYNEKGEVIGNAGIARDITERKHMEETIRHQAYHDMLTGLPNRMLFLDILRVELAQARRARKRLAVLFLDLDRFKEINDTLGHDVGDQLLKEVAVRLRRSMRESDTVARIGGDEFNVLLPEINTGEDAAFIARKILASLRKPFQVAGHEFSVTASIGISIYPDDSGDIETLLKYADIAMYRAKEQGRNTYRFYGLAVSAGT